MTSSIKHGLSAFLTLSLFVTACGRQPVPTKPNESSLRASTTTPNLSDRGGRGGFTLQIQKAGTGSGTVTSNPSGINCGSTCSKSFSSGTTVTLTATPASGSVFAGWSGGGTSGTGTATVTLTANTTVTATFNTSGGGGGGGTFTVSVTKSLSGSGNGTVTSTPSGISCGSTCTASFPAGTSVTLFASPTAGEFTGWTAGPCAGSANQSCTFTLDANTTATAAFATQPLSFLDSTLGDGNVGAEYTQFINTTGGFGSPDMFDIVSGSLPDGLVMDDFFGVQSTAIHGKPTRIQTSNFTVRVRDQSGSATRAFSITINAAVPLVITVPGPTATSGTVGVAYRQNLFADGGKTPYSWSSTGGQLPPGLKFVSASNGNRIEGTPTTRGTFTFTLTVKDSGSPNQTTSQQTTITIN
jgi:putative Ig domain-containing protein/List-Bact-rpt repeat protein